MPERTPDLFSQNLAIITGQAEIDLAAAVTAYNAAFSQSFTNLADCMTDLYQEIGK